jgi:hypothetical protein
MLAELYPICRKCHASMRLAFLEDVMIGPNEQLCIVSVFRCPKCERLTAYELPVIDRGFKVQVWASAK